MLSYEARKPQSPLVSFTAAFLSLVGSTIQLVTLPYWLTNFDNNGYEGGPFTVLFTESLLFFLVFNIWYLGYVIYYKKKFSLKIFFPSTYFKYGLSIGLFDALNGLFIVYNSDPSRVATYLQLIFITAGFLFAPLMTWVFIKDKRNLRYLRSQYLELGHFIALILVVLSIVIISVPYGLDQLSTGPWYYCVFYFLGSLFGNIYNIAQEKYPEKIIDKDVRSKFSIRTEVLAACCFYQLLFICISFPILPATPFANTWSYNGMTEFFASSIKCMFVCKYNFLYYLVFGFGYIITYLGNVVLNEESAVFTILASTLSIPISAVLFFVFSSDQLEDLLYIIPSFVLLILAVGLWRIRDQKAAKAHVETININY